MNITALHMGALHSHEQVLVLVVALGPFLLLGLVIAVLRRQDRLEEEVLARDEDVPAPGADQRDR